MRPMTVPILFHGPAFRTLDQSRPWVEAVLVQDGRITALGDFVTLRPKAAQIRRLDAHTVTPGLIDAHGHLTLLARERGEIDVSKARSADDVIDLLRAASHEGVLVAHGFDHTRWPGAQLPDGRALSAAFPEQAVLVKRVDYHCCWLN